MGKEDERVMCIREKYLAYLLGDLWTREAGFRPVRPFAVTQTVSPLFRLATYERRSLIETDPSYKQLIPYMVLRRGDTLFTYQRTRRGGEQRLHGLVSIGVGGHINDTDARIPATLRTQAGGYEQGCLRELKEEVGLEEEDILKAPVIGIVYHEEDDVGKVHLGIVHEVTLRAGTALHCTDPALANGEFFTLPYLRMQSVLMERWSQLVLEHLF